MEIWKWFKKKTVIRIAVICINKKTFVVASFSYNNSLERNNLYLCKLLIK